MIVCCLERGEPRAEGSKLAPPRLPHSAPWTRSRKWVRDGMGAPTLAAVGGVSFLPSEVWQGHRTTTTDELQEGRHHM